MFILFVVIAKVSLTSDKFSSMVII
jgi:hypothetical protein